MTAPPLHVPSPERVAQSQLTAFQRRVGVADWEALYAHSLAEPDRFWRELLDFSEVPTSGSAEPIRVGDAIETATYFPGLRLSYAETLLRGRGAVVSVTEEGDRVTLTADALDARVRRLASALLVRGVAPGDRVAAIARSDAETVVACLATAAVGAIWSSGAPDMGAEAVTQRLGPLAPKLLFAHTRYQQQGQARSVEALVQAVRAAVPSIARVITLDSPAATPDLGAGVEDIAALVEESDPLTELPRRPFDHPLFILFSSGTTGTPKCIVHGQGGTLLEHLKELRLHTDIGPRDRLAFYTSTGWMMWNWQLSALATGATLVLYDGAVSYPEPDALLSLVARERVTVFGTSPAYLRYCRDAALRAPALPDLRAILSTGSILYPEQYDWAYEHLAPVPLQSISGGTDILGCFVLGNPNLPVWRGESQCISLALDVRAMGPQGPQRPGGGELVCCAPFPSRPVGFYDDAGGARFHRAYFAENDGLWTHGDFVELTERGTARVLGRSDGVLNIQGVRIGPAEIYQALQSVPEVLHALAVDQEDPREVGGRRLVLLVVLSAGASMDRPLMHRIKRTIRDATSRFHIPRIVVPVAALPTTASGKHSERAASDALNGRPVRNRSALRNPESLDALLAEPLLQVPPASAAAGPGQPTAPDDRS